MMVVDASVAAKWLFAEAGREQALALLEGRIPLVAPSILELEVTGAVLRRFREKLLKEESARTLCELWNEILSSGRVRLLPWEELMPAAVGLVFQTRHALYDCLYVASAKQLEVDLITADASMKKRVGQAFPRIKLLETAPVEASRRH